MTRRQMYSSTPAVKNVTIQLYTNNILPRKDEKHKCNEVTQPGARSDYYDMLKEEDTFIEICKA